VGTEAVVTSVERAPEQIRREAEEEADRYLRERRREADGLLDSRERELAELATDLEHRAAILREELERSIKAIEGAAANIGRAAGVPERSGPGQRPTRSQRREPRAASQRQTRTKQKPRTRKGSKRSAAQKKKEDAVMLMATELAVAGRPRDEIAAALKAEFGVADAAQILDRVLGSRD
jgi:hypothetical protein